MTVNGVGWSAVTGVNLWRPLHDSANTFNTSGFFTALADGYYLCSTTLRIDGATSQYFRVILAKNQITTLDGLHSIHGDVPASYYTFPVSGVLEVSYFKPYCY